MVESIIDALAAPDPAPLPLRLLVATRYAEAVGVCDDRLRAASAQTIDDAMWVRAELRMLPSQVVGAALTSPRVLYEMEQGNGDCVACAALALIEASLASGRDPADRALDITRRGGAGRAALTEAGLWMDLNSGARFHMDESERIQLGGRWVLCAGGDNFLDGPVIDSHPRVQEEHESERFQTSLVQALALMQRATPGFRGALEGLLRAVLPMQRVALGAPSASSSGLVGACCLSACDEAELIAEQLAHESSHLLLFALQRVDPLLDARVHGEGWDERLFYSPWRDDLRPLNGLLHGAVVFTRAAFVHARLADTHQVSLRRLAALVPQLRIVVAELRAAATMTPAGARLMRNLADATAILTGVAAELRADRVEPLYLEQSSIQRLHGDGSARAIQHRAVAQLARTGAA